MRAGDTSKTSAVFLEDHCSESERCFSEDSVNRSPPDSPPKTSWWIGKTRTEETKKRKGFDAPESGESKWSQKKTAKKLGVKQQTVSDSLIIAKTVKTDKGKVDKDLATLAGDAPIQKN